MDKKNYSIPIPEYEYFEMGGHYSGSKRGMNFDDFCFHIIPKEEIKVDIWYDVRCFDLAEIVATKIFEQSRDGYHEMLDWIEEQFQLWLKEHKLRPSKLGYYSKEKKLPQWLIDERNRVAAEKLKNEGESEE